MKLTSALFSALLGSAMAAPLETRIVAQEFDVSEFTAGCVPHGTQCSIAFNVATNQMPYQTHCTFTGAPLGTGSLPDVGFTKCQDPTIIWSFRRVIAGDGAAPFYEFALATAEQSLAASTFFPGSDFPLINAGSSFHQQFTGNGRFVVKP
ncbi:hypothetical protein B0T16DRAFT_428456 [Cercophora newfieldiana]|uniref:Hypersensitive response-inducing protein n=1 Tax=Cercophora newfieldiana TaxID=92897 RepID=A0AA39YDK0_9PEZI|nr:hypothetical protein B0T16DRAFT_428456 [Cercophora newfieldiana]